MARCLACKAAFTPGRNTQGKYCDNACQVDFQLAAKFLQIRKLKRKPKGVGPWVMKQYLLATRGHRCRLCKLTEWRKKPIPLVQDHIDGNSENWKLSNLRLICNNCDAQTDTYKGRNKGNGRHSRRLRYAAGKSY